MMEKIRTKLLLIVAVILAVSMSFPLYSFATEMDETEFDIQSEGVLNELSEEMPTDQNVQERVIVLEVYKDSTLVKDYTMAELGAITSGNYTYSAYNTYPTWQFCQSAQGPTVEGILKDAGLFDSIKNDQIITFVGSDGVDFPFTKDRLFCQRFCFPNGYDKSYATGGEVVAGTETGATPVEPILNLEDEGQLYFGQLTPNDQNYSRFCQKVAHRSAPQTGPAHVGKIIVSSSTAQKGDPITCKNYKDGDSIPVGTKVKFNNPYEGGERYWMYYTTDGSTPKVGSKLYNSSIYNGYINPPVIQKGKNTIKFLGYGYDMLDSDVTEFTFYGVTPAPSGVSATNNSTSSVRVSWKAVSGATKYSVYRNGVKLTDVAGTSFTNYGLALGRYYSYKVSAWVDDEEGQISQAVSAMPAVKTPSITRLAAGKKKIKVSWSRSSDGNGYKVYKSTSPYSGFKCVKTIKKAKTTSFTCKKLKKNTTYYFKVMAYKKVGKKYYYGYYSAVKGARAK